MIYVGDVGTAVNITITDGLKIKEIYVRTSYNNGRYKIVFKRVDNLISFILPPEATTKPGHILFEIVSDKGSLKSKQMVVNENNNIETTTDYIETINKMKNYLESENFNEDDEFYIN